MATKNYKIAKNSSYHLAVSATGYISQELRNQVASANRAHSISLLKNVVNVRFNVQVPTSSALITRMVATGSQSGAKNITPSSYYEFIPGETVGLIIDATGYYTYTNSYVIGTAREVLYNISMTAIPTTVTLTIKTSQPSVNVMVHNASTNAREGTVSGSGVNWVVTGLKTNVSYILTCTPTSLSYQLYESIITLTEDKSINVIYLQTNLGGGGIKPGDPGIILSTGASVDVDMIDDIEETPKKTKRKRKSKNK